MIKRNNVEGKMSTQAYYKERLGFDPADTIAEHHREQRSQHGYEESLSKFKGQRNGLSGYGDDYSRQILDPSNPVSSQGCWGCWAMFIEAHGRCSNAKHRFFFISWDTKFFLLHIS